MVRRFLVVPLLAPWVLVLLVAVLNPRPQLSLRLLIWSSAPLPIGTWLALVSSTGALFSLSATALALQGRRNGGGGAASGGRFVAARRVHRSSEAVPDRAGEQVGRAAPAPAPAAAAGPVRSPGDPPPMVSVPFRVIRKGTASGAASTGPSVASTPDHRAGDHRLRRAWGSFMGRPPQPVSRPAATAAVGGDGWGDPEDDDW